MQSSNDKPTWYGSLSGNVTVTSKSPYPEVSYEIDKFLKAVHDIEFEQREKRVSDACRADIEAQSAEPKS